MHNNAEGDDFSSVPIITLRDESVEEYVAVVQKNKTEKRTMIRCCLLGLFWETFSVKSPTSTKPRPLSMPCWNQAATTYCQSTGVVAPSCDASVMEVCPLTRKIDDDNK